MSEGKESELFFLARQKKSVASRISALVDQVGSAAELARLAGVSETAVRNWKSGESEPTVSRLVRLARCTGVDVGWLATGEGAAGAALGVGEVLETGGPYASGIAPNVVEEAVLAVEDWHKMNPATTRLQGERLARLVRVTCEEINERGSGSGRRVVERLMSIAQSSGE